MTDFLDLPLADVARALREREVSARELTEAALARHDARGERLHAYAYVDAGRALADARRADRMLEDAPRGGAIPPLCGIPLSVKDLYGVEGMPTFAGTARRLPPAWERDAWLVARAREQGAVLVGKTHTVELAFGGVGINPHWGTPRNPWDAGVHRIPGGSSSGAGVSLHEGSALVALGSDTGGSIRIPASMTGTVGHKTTEGRWPTDGVVPLSHTLDTVGALTRSAADARWFFHAIEPRAGDAAEPDRRIGVPDCGPWRDCAPDIRDALHGALDELAAAGWERAELDGGLLDHAAALYFGSGIAGTECLAFLRRDLPEWIDVLDPIVGRRLQGAAPPTDPGYLAALEERERLAAGAGDLFRDAAIVALPTATITPPPVAGLAEDMDRYVEVNRAVLSPTCPVNTLGLCAVTIPVGLDGSGMPVGLQLVAPGGRDEALLAAAVAVERVLGTPRERLGAPPGVPPAVPPAVPPGAPPGAV